MLKIIAISSLLITGVIFVDKAYGQTGKAPQHSVEIHLILKIKLNDK